MSTPTWTIFHEAAGFTTPECWVASSKGGTFSFRTKEAAERFIESPRAKSHNPGPKPLIDDHFHQARGAALTRLGRGRIAKAATAALGLAYRQCNDGGDYQRGLGAGVERLTGIAPGLSSKINESTAVATTKESRALWSAELDRLEETVDRDYRIGFLFAGLALAQKNKEYRYR